MFAFPWVTNRNSHETDPCVIPFGLSTLLIFVLYEEPCQKAEQKDTAKENEIRFGGLLTMKANKKLLLLLLLSSF